MKGYTACTGNRWYAVIYHGLDPVTGREQRSWHAAGASQDDAETLARKLVNEIQGRDDEGRSLTFGAYLTDRWLPSKQIALRPTTFAGYRRNVELHILPVLGKVKIRRLTIRRGPLRLRQAEVDVAGRASRTDRPHGRARHRTTSAMQSP